MVRLIPQIIRGSDLQDCNRIGSSYEGGFLCRSFLAQVRTTYPLKPSKYTFGFSIFTATIVSTIVSCSYGLGKSPCSIAIANPVNLCAEKPSWTIKFALPEGNYFASLFIILPGDEVRGFSDSPLKLAYTLRLANGYIEEDIAHVSLSQAAVGRHTVMEVRPTDSPSVQKLRSRNDPWPWESMLSESPRRVYRVPLGIGITDVEGASQGALTVEVLNPESVPSFLCNAEFRIDSYMLK